MEVIRNKNYARQTDLIFDDIHFIECNFAQEDMNTRLEIINSKFERCNLVNCDIHNSNEIIDCNINQIDFNEVQ